MPGLQGFPICLQGFQQVEEAFLGFQKVGTSVRMQEFELVLQLGDIISYGHHRFFAPRGGKYGSSAVGGGLWVSFIFLRSPEEKRTKKKGAQSGKRTRPAASNSFSRGGRHRKQHPPSIRGEGIPMCRMEKESGLWLLTAFPGAGNAGCIFYPLYKGAAGKSAGRSEFICKPSPFSA